MKLAKEFYCVPPGEIYPRTLAAGDHCPQELVASARELGVLAEGDERSDLGDSANALAESLRTPPKNAVGTKESAAGKTGAAK